MSFVSREEFDRAHRRILARSWLLRSRMVHSSGEWCPREMEILAGDSPEQAERDLQIYQEWSDRQGLIFY